LIFRFMKKKMDKVGTYIVFGKDKSCFAK